MFNSPVFIAKHLLSFFRYIYFITQGGAREELHKKKPFHGFFNFSVGQVRENPSTPLKLRVKWYLYLSMSFQQINFEHVNPRKGLSRAIVIFK